MKPRDFLIALDYHYDGDWRKIYHDICERTFHEELLEDENVKALCESDKVVTILDSNYPSQLRRLYMSPFVLHL